MSHYKVWQSQQLPKIADKHANTQVNWILNRRFYKDFGQDTVAFSKMTRPLLELYSQFEMNTESSLENKQRMHKQGSPCHSFLIQLCR